MLPLLRRGIPVCEIMDGGGVERIDGASMAILEEVGVVSATPSRSTTGAARERTCAASGSTSTAASCAS